MAGEIEIPQGRMEEDDPSPCWIAVVDGEGRHLKPVIRCQCGAYTGIGLHHVHADGMVTASFFHTKDGPYGDPNGCEWHVHLKLKDYNLGDFPPEPR